MDGASPILQAVENELTTLPIPMRARRTGWALTGSSQRDLGNVSHSRVNHERHVHCKGPKYDHELWKEDSPESVGLQESDLEERVESKVVCWKSCDISRLVNASKVRQS